MQIILTNEESLSIFHTALCNGLQYFSGYGCELNYSEQDYAIAKDKLKLNQKSVCYEDVIIQILKDGNSITIEDIEGEGSMTKTISIEDVYDKVKNAPFRYIYEMTEGLDDAETADVILQTVFFNEIIFG